MTGMNREFPTPCLYPTLVKEGEWVSSASIPPGILLYMYVLNTLHWQVCLIPRLCVYDVQELNEAGCLYWTSCRLGWFVGLITQNVKHVFGPASFVARDISSIGITISNASAVSGFQFQVWSHMHCLFQWSSSILCSDAIYLFVFVSLAKEAQILLQRPCLWTGERCSWAVRFSYVTRTLWSSPPRPRCVWPSRHGVLLSFSCPYPLDWISHLGVACTMPNSFLSLEWFGSTIFKPHLQLNTLSIMQAGPLSQCPMRFYTVLGGRNLSLAAKLIGPAFLLTNNTELKVCCFARPSSQLWKIFYLGLGGRSSLNRIQILEGHIGQCWPPC